MAHALELSLVIPVYNGSDSIGEVVRRIHQVFAGTQIEVVLVNDGSSDNSEQVCSELADQYSTVKFLQLSCNFGEHSAVLAGLNHAAGDYVAVLDDDGQNPPEEVPRLLTHLKQHNYDVVYGRYIEKRHNWFRNLGSWLNDRMANIMLKKPPDIYLSSFKVMNRFLVNEIIKYQGAFPYIDGLIYRSTRTVGQIPVEHRNRAAGQSGYTLKKLIKLWLNMFLGFSIVPLRTAVVAGIGIAAASGVYLVAIVVEILWINPKVERGIPSILACVIFSAGVQLIVLGAIGEYLGRLFLNASGTPQYIVRYVKEGDRKHD